MTDAQTPDRWGSAPLGFSPSTALRLAWLCWCVLLVIPFFLALWLIWHLSGGAAAPHPPHPLRDRWFLGPMIYLILVVPVSLFWRGRVFKPYWSGRTVPPGKYLLGMLAIWLALAGCLVHARYDFPFQVHSIVFLFLVLCAILFVLSRRPGRGDG